MAWLKSFFGGEQRVARNAVNASPIDVVVYLASLASNPQSIDLILDPLRDITARLGPDRMLNDQDQLVLAKVYKGLVAHLITNEPAQIFTQEGLEARIKNAFSPEKIANKIFWDELARR
jgi:hypothetical protein